MSDCHREEEEEKEEEREREREKEVKESNLIEEKVKIEKRER